MTILKLIYLSISFHKNIAVIVVLNLWLACVTAFRTEASALVFVYYHCIDLVIKGALIKWNFSIRVTNICLFYPVFKRTFFCQVCWAVFKDFSLVTHGFIWQSLHFLKYVNFLRKFVFLAAGSNRLYKYHRIWRPSKLEQFDSTKTLLKFWLILKENFPNQYYQSS